MRELWEFMREGHVYVIPSLNATAALCDAGPVYDVFERAKLKTAGVRRQEFIAKAQGMITLRSRFDMIALTEAEARELIDCLQQALSPQPELTV